MLWSKIENQSKMLGAILTRNHLTIATAESCTGGGIAYAITEIAGSSAYFNQSWVTYSNQAKQTQLGVSAGTLEQFGAVSSQTVAEMAQGVYKNSGANLAIVTSGIAGPGGATPDKPVGLVHFGFLFNPVNSISNSVSQVLTSHNVFSGDRKQVRDQAISYALEKAIEIANNSEQKII